MTEAVTITYEELAILSPRTSRFQDDAIAACSFWSAARKAPDRRIPTLGRSSLVVFLGSQLPAAGQEPQQRTAGAPGAHLCAGREHEQERQCGIADPTRQTR